MTDIALLWDNTAFAADLALQSGQLVTDDGLRTAIIISLFTDARAPDGVELPEANDDRRGWWGNAYAADGTLTEKGREIGSLLWLLRRSKITSQGVIRARGYARDALQWLLDDRVITTLDVVAEAQGQRLAIGIIISRPSGPARERFDFTWEASL